MSLSKCDGKNSISKKIQQLINKYTILFYITLETTTKLTLDDRKAREKSIFSLDALFKNSFSEEHIDSIFALIK